MLITQQQQEQMLSQYMKNHNIDECSGFADGLSAMLDLMVKITKKTTRK